MIRKFIRIVIVISLLSIRINAHYCESQLFSVTIKKELSIEDAIDNIAETCGLSVVVKDVAAQKKLQDKLFYIKLRNVTLENFLDTILKENNLNYKLIGNKLIISYLITKTFKIHYIASKREGGSSANINIANASMGKNSGITTSSGMRITSNDKFDFWNKLKSEVHRVLVASGDGSLHFTKLPDGTWIEESTKRKWQYNPFEPIVDPEAGLVTVTGTPRQIRNVAKYLSSLANQVKTQVLIDVKILSVTLNQDKQTGIDWSQLYGLQNFTISSLAMSQQNMLEWKSENGKISDAKFAPNTTPKNASLFDMRGVKSINDIIKFLKTQGVVKTISNPKIMTLNNQPALISVGKELFYKIKTSTTTQDDNGQTTSETIDSVFAGILLDITPEIDKRGMITLKINPSITETDGPIGESGTRTMPPDLIRRQISTVIKVKDGKHAILGGLISTAESVVDSKVPLLGDIPFFGEAFKKRRKVKRTEELVVIITPKIISGRKNISLKSLGYRSIVK